MSLIGIDVGSSSVKAAAYSEAGELLYVTSRTTTPLHPAPGLWEEDPAEIWQATSAALKELAGCDAVKKDPPIALAISASGRENFPADAKGNALANNIMGADIRGMEYEAIAPGISVPESWELSCGHMRERMDPVFRLLWWRENMPGVMAEATQFLDWHAHIVFRLCGRNVSEPSLVGRWLTYDLNTDDWDEARLRQYGIEKSFLPEVLPAGTPVEKICGSVAKELGLPENLLVVTGGHDLNCAGLGAGVNELGMACLISGSYENMLIPTLQYPTAGMLKKGLSITPHFSDMKRSVYAICPTGNAVLNWTRATVGKTIEAMEEHLKTCIAPSPVIAAPHLSGAMLHYENRRNLRGTLLGLTLATTPQDIVQAFMEGIAYENANTLKLLATEGVEVTRIRATGGGTRSSWWNQMKADMMGVSIEIAAEPEPGAYGAAILAGLGAGVYKSLKDIGGWRSGKERVYTPNAARRELHEARYQEYCALLAGLSRWYGENT